MEILVNLKPGEDAIVIEVKGGKGLRQKLNLRGIFEGSVIRVISCNPGPVVLEVDRNTVAIGKGMAQKIMVNRRS
jgi:ferrous iron transport protein A